MPKETKAAHSERFAGAGQDSARVRLVDEERARSLGSERIDPDAGRKSARSLTLVELFKLVIEFIKITGATWALCVTVFAAFIGWMVAIRHTISPVMQWAASIGVLMETVCFCFVIELLHDKVRRIFELIKLHPEVRDMDPESRHSVERFAKPLTSYTTLLFLPIAGVLLIGPIWNIGP